MDGNDILTETGIAPPTYDKRLPDLFQPFSTSASSLAWAAANEVVPITIITNVEVAQSHLFEFFR